MFSQLPPPTHPEKSVENITTYAPHTYRRKGKVTTHKQGHLQAGYQMLKIGKYTYPMRWDANRANFEVRSRVGTKGKTFRATDSDPRRLAARYVHEQLEHWKQAAQNLSKQSRVAD